ncbi:MAG: nucleoside deaminase [Flavobacteriales bacterium]|nr:nucleoside deaminase [Flavobacteriales bacterium]
MLIGDEYFMKQALKQASRAYDDDEVPIGAVVVMGNQVIGKGYNQSERLTDGTAHAEILALTAAFQYLGSTILNECTLYVTIEPCVMCAGALYWARIGSLVYGAPEPKSGFSLFEPNILHPSTQVKSGVLADEAKFLMQDYFQTKRQR